MTIRLVVSVDYENNGLITAGDQYTDLVWRWNYTATLEMHIAEDNQSAVVAVDVWHESITRAFSTSKQAAAEAEEIRRMIQAELDSLTLCDGLNTFRQTAERHRSRSLDLRKKESRQP